MNQKNQITPLSELICHKKDVHTCRLGRIHLSEREALILEDWVERHTEEALRANINKNN